MALFSADKPSLLLSDERIVASKQEEGPRASAFVHRQAKVSWSDIYKRCPCVWTAKPSLRYYSAYTHYSHLQPRTTQHHIGHLTTNKNDHTDTTPSKPTYVEERHLVAREINYVGQLLEEIYTELTRLGYAPRLPLGLVQTATAGSPSSSPETSFQTVFIPDEDQVERPSGTDGTNAKREIWNTLADYRSRLTAGLRGRTETRFKEIPNAFHVLDSTTTLSTFAPHEVTYASVLKYRLDQILDDDKWKEKMQEMLKSIEAVDGLTAEQRHTMTTAVDGLERCVTSLGGVRDWLKEGNFDARSGYE